VPRGLHPRWHKNLRRGRATVFDMLTSETLSPRTSSMTTFRSSATETQARLPWNDRTPSGTPKECSMSLQHYAVSCLRVTCFVLSSSDEKAIKVEAFMQSSDGQVLLQFAAGNQGWLPKFQISSRAAVTATGRRVSFHSVKPKLFAG